jgi:Icc-related predicted phosphoesterase
MHTIIPISDTHCTAYWQIVPACDIFIHAGDLCSYGTAKEYFTMINRMSRVEARLRIFVPGNHDKFVEKDPHTAIRLAEENGVKLLLNEAFEWEGIKFFGCSYVSDFSSGYWAFERYGTQRKEFWESVPAPVDILITHNPPFGILDGGDHIGCQYELEAVRRIKPKHHIFGHCHGPGGKSADIWGTQFHNVAWLNEEYQWRKKNKPLQIQYVS